ncbi:2-oxoglutarate and iron-dependent oxygenase domain-containing protein 2 isoform X5 [Rhincodon typus]|uniref:2-oxoglutarate and iron-dependent oxygenase domain-containing protein 2 isoform X5 n=1 Tax=Rhincodon typus TaxID=259920 RepID=UPI0020305746|nr:2-oxoglutarate and iron-dependent oxygenase domain-containing protein 2 isoform X5 [Rhincodon typus]
MDGAGGSPGPRPRPAPRGPFFSCRCFHTDNIFLEDFRLHVRSTDPQLESVLRSKGCKTEGQFRKVQAKIDEEVQRRKLLHQKSLERRNIISACYKPLNPEVYVLQESFLAPEFHEIVAYCRSEDADFEGLLDHIHSLPAERVYSIPVFTEEFCGQLIGELENFEQSEMPKGRPNTMNNYGVPVSERECVEIEHRVSYGLLHRGQHCHGALPISSGERWNLIIWMRSSPVRNELCPMCNRKPELVEASGFGDGFTSELSEVWQERQETVSVCTLC